MKVKERAREVIDQLPEDASWDDVMYAVYVRQVVEAGLADLDAGRKQPHAEVKARFGLRG
jgi:hypothetical protein